jgi:8-oxo-dGTP pyrophosphatase MutT (NUDIX family)
MLHAAVVVPIVGQADPAIVFVRRAAHLRRNPGQIAFPGGVIDDADGGDPRVAALREFEEELGVPRERVRITAQLEDVVTLSLGVRVTPYLGVLAEPPAWQPDPSETESVHEVPLRALYARGALHEGTEVVEREGARFTVETWLFDHGAVHVWGATARILAALLARYPRIDSLPLAAA